MGLRFRRAFFWRCRNSGHCPASTVPDSTLHFRALWRLHKSWPLDFKLALAAAVAAQARRVAGSHLERRSHLRPVASYQVPPTFFGVLDVRAPKTSRQQVHAHVQHVLVECPGLALLLKALQLRAQVGLWRRLSLLRRRVSSRPSPRPRG